MERVVDEKENVKLCAEAPKEASVQWTEELLAVTFASQQLLDLLSADGTDATDKDTSSF